MWALFLGSASATTWTVGAGQAFPTVAGAAAAASAGDTLEIHPGTYTEAVVLPVPLHLVGVGSPVIRTPAGARGPALHFQRGGSLGDLRLQGQGGDCVKATRSGGGPASLAISGVRFAGCAVALEVLDQVSASVDRSQFLDSELGALLTAAGDLAVSSTSFLRNHQAIRALSSGRLQVEDSVFALQGRRAAPFQDVGVITVWGGSGGLLVQGNRFCANGVPGNRSVATLDLVTQVAIAPAPAHEVWVVDNLFQDNVGVISAWPSNNLGGAPVLTELVMFQNTLVGNEAAGVVGNGMVAMWLDSNVFAHHSGQAAVTEGGGGASITGNWNLFHQNPGGDLDGTVFPGDLRSSRFGVDPRWTALSLNGNCLDDDLTPLPGSPLLDAGQPAVQDPDGTRADIGWMGY